MNNLIFPKGAFANGKALAVSDEVLEIPCEPSEVSDGYHTFGELYSHRCYLFLALCVIVNKAGNTEVFRTRKNQNGEEWAGWFILGMNTSYGQITYHLPDSMWGMANGIKETERNSSYDGHNSSDVLERLRKVIAEYL